MFGIQHNFIKNYIRNYWLIPFQSHFLPLYKLINQFN